VTATAEPPASKARQQTRKAGSTLPEEQTLDQLRRALWGRRVLVGLLTLIVAAALSGVLGVHARSTTASGGGYQVTVRHAVTARPGMTVPFEIEVRRDAGFSGPVQLAVSAHYLQALQVGTLLPQPASSTADDTLVVLSFDEPQGDTLHVTVQAEVDPSTDAGRYRGQVSVLDAGGTPVTASFTTWVWP
jgi:hypothetical protein